MEESPILRNKLRKFRSEQAPTIFLTTIVASLASLVFAPFSIVLGFWLNDYLARPILSIEYAEIVPHVKEVEPPRKEIETLIKSSYFQMNVLTSKAGNANALAAYSALETATWEEMEKLKQITLAYLDLVKKRKTELRQFGLRLEKVELSDARLTKLIDEHAVISGESKMSGLKLETAIKSFNTRIEDEIKKGIDPTISMVNSLLGRINKSPTVDKLYFKLSVQNRGNTDGLVRAKGSVEFAELGKKLVIVSCVPPSKKKTRQAIAVTIADDTPEPIRSTSVGKIEKNTLSEFWFCLDLTTTENDFKGIVKSIKSQKAVAFRLDLLDHQNGNISRTFPIKTK